jgi:putative transposase
MRCAQADPAIQFIYAQDPLIAWSDAARCDSGHGGGAAMPTPPFLLTTAQMRRLSPHFPLSHGIARVDDRRVLSGIIYVIRNGLQWRDAPAAYGPRKTLYNRFVRWSRMGVFDRIFAALAAEGGPPERLMIDSTHLKAHRTAASLLKKGLFPAASGEPRAA